MGFPTTIRADATLVHLSHQTVNSGTPNYNSLRFGGLSSWHWKRKTFFQSRGTWGGVCRARQPAQKHKTSFCDSHVRVLDQEFVMGGNYGGRAGRGGSTSRHEGIEKSTENSKEKKENQPSGMKISAEETRKVVVKFLKDLSGNTNPKKVPRLLNRLSEETIRALSFMRTLKYVTDKELIAKYIAAEVKREEWFIDEGWPFTADVKPDELPLLTYGTVARCYGKTVYPSETDDAFFEFINTPEGMLRTAGHLRLRRRPVDDPSWIGTARRVRQRRKLVHSRCGHSR